MAPATSWVYFIQEGADGPIKIGYTAGHPSVRLRSLQTGASRTLTLLCYIPGDQQVERGLHEKFQADRVRPGGEWFYPSHALMAFVAGVWAASSGNDTGLVLSANVLTGALAIAVEAMLRHAAELERNDGIPEDVAEWGKRTMGALGTVMSHLRYIGAHDATDILSLSVARGLQAMKEANDA